MKDSPATMSEARSIKLDLAALALLALCVFLGMALATYNRADSFDGLVYPAPAKTTNACGRSGAVAAELLLQGLRRGSLLPGGFAGRARCLAARATAGDARARCAPSAGSVSLLAMCTLVSLLGPAWSLGPVIGPGGYVGAAGRGLLEMHFASAGAYILTLSLLVAGLLLVHGVPATAAVGPRAGFADEDAGADAAGRCAVGRREGR